MKPSIRFVIHFRCAKCDFTFPVQFHGNQARGTTQTLQPCQISESTSGFQLEGTRFTGYSHVARGAQDLELWRVCEPIVTETTPGDQIGRRRTVRSIYIEPMTKTSTHNGTTDSSTYMLCYSRGGSTMSINLSTPIHLIKVWRPQMRLVRERE